MREPATFAGDPIGELMHPRMSEPFKGMLRGYRFGQARRLFGGSSHEDDDWCIMDII